jgi:sarcosine oxidase subunit alpha
MGSFDFEGREVPFENGDTVASALYRAGVRTFTRSFKYHRRRGLYCLTGDCPNCMVAVDGDPAVRSCACAASDGLKVEREDGMPSADFDLLAVMDRLHRLTPVGFYYKTFIRPRWAWEFAEKIIRRATGLGRLPVDAKPTLKKSRFLHADVLVVGAGVAGLAAARAASARGESVVVCDEGTLGEKTASAAVSARIRALASDVSFPILQRYAAIGVYEGPLVPLVGEKELVQVRAERVIVATGAVESHGVFEGNDLPGVWLGRGAARMAGAHGVRPGARAVVVGLSHEAEEQTATLRESGVEIVAVLRDERIVRTIGRKTLRGVVVESEGRRRRIACDALVLSTGFAPRDTLLRMGKGLPVIGAGQVVWPSCSLKEAEASGTRAGEGHDESLHAGADPAMGGAGFVCLCEDVSVGDLEKSWEEGWHSSEIIKRYIAAQSGI